MVDVPTKIFICTFISFSNLRFNMLEKLQKKSFCFCWQLVRFNINIRRRAVVSLMNGHRGHIIKWGHWSKRSRSGQPALGWRLPDSVIQLKLIPSHCPVPSVHHSQKSAVLTARLQGGDPANWSSFREHRCVDSFLEPLQTVSTVILM